MGYLFDMIAGMNMAAQEHVTDYSQITDYIFIGSDLCKGNICPVHSEEFKKLDIHTEIDLDIEHDEPVTPYLDAYLRLPTPDHQAPTQQQLSVTDSINLIKMKRPEIHLESAQVAALEIFAKQAIVDFEP